MQIRPVPTFAFALLLALPRPVQSETTPIALNDHARLGQVFSTPQPVSAVAVTVPSWTDAEGGLTLSLWESPARRQLLGRRVFTDVADNASVELPLKAPLPAGSYYWEVDQRTGNTQIGLYVDTLKATATDCAYLDGTPHPNQRFLFRFTLTSFRFLDIPSMLAALKDGSRPDQEDACRQLAFQGTPDCIQPLADLLPDPKRSQWARYALESMPGPAVDAALRAALDKLDGALAAGVIHSLGARRDAGAIPLLRQRLAHRDPVVACAAADALGKIATPDAAGALLPSLNTAPSGLRASIADALLTCAERLFQEGNAARSAPLFDAVRQAPGLPSQIVAGALRGALEARGETCLPLLIEVLRGGDPAMTAAALGVIQQGLAGLEITQRLAPAFPELSPATQPAIIQALGTRGDASALAAFAGMAGHRDPQVRRAVVQALQELNSPQAAPLLARLLRDPDPAVAGAAESALALLPGSQADAQIVALSREGEKPLRLAGIRLAGTRTLESARESLLAAGRDTDPDIRVAALVALKGLARPEDLPSLLDLLAQARSPGEREASEAALSAACSQSGTPDLCAAELTRRLGEGDALFRAACLRLLAGLGDRWGRQPVLAAASGNDPELRATAFRLLYQWPAPEAAPDLLKLSASTPDAAGRSLCLRGGLRLAGMKGLPLPQAISICRDATSLIQRDDEKKLLLGTLGNLASPAALPLANAFLADPAVGAEAAAALISIAESLVSSPHAKDALPFVEAVAAHPPSSGIGQRAKILLSRLRPSKPVP